MLYLVTTIRRSSLTQADNIEHFEPYETEEECISRAKTLRDRGYADPARIEIDGAPGERAIHMDRAALTAAMAK